MKKLFADNIITAIDVGTTKICVLIGQQVTEGVVEILGIGKVPSEGLRKGVVVDMAKTIRSIKDAVEEAQLMANVRIESAVVGVSGSHIQSRNVYGAVPIGKKGVTQEDIANVIANAKAVPLAEGQQVLHVLPQYFSIDGQERVQDPLGMFGVRLEAHIHMITGSVASVHNLVSCCEQAGVIVQDVILEQLASAKAVLNDDERDLGVGMIDIGGGTTDLAVYQRGTICHTKVIPIAGNHFTNDLAIGLRITTRDAERIKRDYGLANSRLLENDTIIEGEMVQGETMRAIHMKDITEILEARSQELLSFVHEEILSHHLSHILVSGLVITGGGSMLEGLKEVAEDMCRVPVRIGRPRIVHNDPEILSNPIYATGYGLLLLAGDKKHSLGLFNEDQRGVTRLLIRMKSWVSDFF
jgi:cell division protein FtsA